MDTVTPQMDEWRALPWKQLQRTVFRLQKRIYQVSLRGDTRQVVQLQKEGLDNLQLLHRHCHDQKTKQDGSMAARSSGAQRGAV